MGSHQSATFAEAPRNGHRREADTPFVMEPPLLHASTPSIRMDRQDPFNNACILLYADMAEAATILSTAALEAERVFRRRTEVIGAEYEMMELDTETSLQYAVARIVQSYHEFRAIGHRI